MVALAIFRVFTRFSQSHPVTPRNSLGINKLQTSYENRHDDETSIPTTGIQLSNEATRFVKWYVNQFVSLAVSHVTFLLELVCQLYRAGYSLKGSRWTARWSCNLWSCSIRCVGMSSVTLKKLISSLSHWLFHVSCCDSRYYPIWCFNQSYPVTPRNSLGISN